MGDPLALGLSLLGAALLLVIIEVFVPSAGVISLVATVIAISGIVVLFRVSVLWGIIGILAMLILGPLVAFFSLQILPSTPVGKKLLFGEGGGEAAEPDESEDDERERLIGTQGVALTDLRPVGSVRVDGKRMEALSEIGLIPAGTTVRVTSVDGNQIKVRPQA